MAGRTNPNPWLVLAKLIGTLAVTGVLAAGVLLPFVGGVGLAAKHEADQFLSKTCNLTETPPPQKSEIYASDGTTPIATIFKQDRQPIGLDEVPKTLRQALVDTEDRRFYSHHGVDLRGLIRSAISTSSGDTQGGSTLTMQYVKQVRYYEAGDNKAKQQAAIDQNINRKIEDAKCALYIEGTLHRSKDRILRDYLNIAFFGENSYGIQTAAQTYFDKPASQLSVPESAMLVGLLRAPTQYDPFLNHEAAQQRRNEVLQNMVTSNDLTQAQADKYKASPVSLATSSPPQVRQGCANASTTIANVGFFCDYAVNWLLDHKVVSEAQLQTGGLKIVTTLKADLQRSMQRNIAKALAANADMTAVMPVVDPRTGNILAMATSKKYGVSTSGDATTLPIFTSYTAQGASTYKLFPLLTALSTGVPRNWELQNPPDGVYKWTVCSKDNGNVSNGDANETYVNGANEPLDEATAKSSNTFYVGIADNLFGCDLQPIIDMARKLGMQSLSRPSDERGLTIADSILKYSSATRLVLGDIQTSPLELTSAYAAVANGGRYHAPNPIVSVTDSKGHDVPVTRSQGVQVVSPQVAYQAVEILSGDTTGVGTSAAAFTNWYAKNPSIISGKTGTAPGLDLKTHKDDRNGALWFVGMTPKLTATTALINLDYPSHPASDLPGLENEKVNAYGSYAAGVWLKALEPSLVKQHWTWQSSESVPGDPVPVVTGHPLDEARAMLKAKGYRMQILDAANGLICASKVTPNDVAFYGPQIAPKGATITVCPSSGVEQTLYHKPPPPPPPSKTKTPTNSSSRSSGSNNGGGRGSSSGSPSGGRSTSPGSGGSGGGRGGGGGISIPGGGHHSR